MQIPRHLLPHDGRFGSGPAKIRPEALTHFVKHADLLGTSHRKPPVKQLVSRIRGSLSELYQLPDDYEVVLGNGGASLVWDMATCCLIENRCHFGVFGEFSRKFANAVSRADQLSTEIAEAAAGKIALPPAGEADSYAWAHNETSTGTIAPVERNYPGLILVDGTSAAGGTLLDVTTTDLYYFAPQKNFSSDGGLWLAFASPAAIDQAEQIAKTQRWIPDMLNFLLALDNSRKNQTLNTPAISTLLLLEAQLNWLDQLGGLSAAAERCAKSSGLLYHWAQHSDYATPFVADPAHRSPVVATIDLSESVDAGKLISILRDNGIVDVDPYRSLGRNQLRIGCYAAVDPDDVAALICCIDYVVERM